MRSLAILILFSIISASPAYALTIQASPAQESIIERQWERLSPCLQSHIDNKLKRVKVVRHGKLGDFVVPNDEPVECLAGQKKPKFDVYYIHAISVFMAGVIVLDTLDVKPEIIMHEFGHWFTNDVIRKQYWAAWKQALKLDVADMDKCDLYDNDYLKDPDEAAAQIFSAQVLGKDYSSKADYDVSSFTRTNAMMAQILAKTCPG